MLHILAVMLQTVLWVHPPTRSLCDVRSQNLSTLAEEGGGKGGVLNCLTLA